MTDDQQLAGKADTVMDGRRRERSRTTAVNADFERRKGLRTGGLATCDFDGLAA
jgi:hypothetical protein